MTEETLFAEAIEKSAPAERAAFLDAACRGDAAMRRRVEALLQSHAREDFLKTPAIQRAAEVAGGSPIVGATEAEVHGDDSESALDFLVSSEKPDSLGRLGHYEVQEMIGRGGMGVVLRAFDEKLHRVVAIKVMAAQLATNANARKRFQREAQAAAAVSHDHLVTIHAVEETNELPYIVMQYVAGLSLQQRLDRDGPLQLHEILRIGMQTASGLAAAHAQGLIHRDIKPANILLENGVERVKITDFGLARALTDASLTQSGVVAGTPQYMAPEQAEGKAVDQRTDLFSLGSVLYAMCTGRAPFRASGTMAVLKRVCEETPTPIRETNAEIPDWLVAIIDKLHAKDPAGRYQTAAEVAEVLNQHLAHLQHPSIAPLPVTRLDKPPTAGRRRIVLALALLCLVATVIGVGAALLGVFSPEDTPVGKVKLEPAGTKLTSTAKGFTPLFNGKDLTGWATAQGGTGMWRIEDGAITCTGPADHLLTIRNDFGDFHLRADVKINANGNSGIYFRTGKPLAVVGDYEAQITNNPGQQYKTGSLWGLVRVSESPVPPETWFTLEIIAVGKRIRILINGKETADYTENRVGRNTKGHIALQHYDSETCVFFRKIEIKELPAAKSAAEGAFVILGGKSVPERKFDTLAEAVQSAGAGDTIEVRGNGPFVTEPIRTKLSLTIRAGEGFRPVLKLTPDKLNPNLQTTARLVLEGLDLQLWRQVADDAEFKPLVASEGADPLYLANCRFYASGKRANGSLVLSRSEEFVARNCEFLSPNGAQIAWRIRRKSVVVLDNCVLIGAINLYLGSYQAHQLGDFSVRLTQSTLLSAYMPTMVLTLGWELPAEKNNPLQAAASASIFDTRNLFGINSLNTPLADKKPVPSEVVVARLRSVLTWRDRLNLYAPSGSSVLTQHNKEQVTVGAKNLPDWKRFWGLPDGDAIEGRIRYQNGDLLAKLRAAPEKITPEDFRLRPDSAGYRAGKDGKDLGADVDLVGPGPAYERWKKTPEYQQWLKETGQVKK